MDIPLTDEYTLWLEPAGEVQEKLQYIIDDIAGRAFTIPFAPHLTLLGGIQGEEASLVEKTKTLAASGASVFIQTGDTSTGETYHTSFFFECDRPQTLLKLRAEAEELFATHPPAYNPHVSLAYGLDDPILIATLTGELSGKSYSFESRTLSLWHAKGTPAEWRKVATFSLGVHTDTAAS